MNTEILEQRIKELESEIADDERQIRLRTLRIKDNKKALKIFKDGLERLMNEDADKEDKSALGQNQ